MPALAHETSTRTLDIALLGMMTDYPTLCAPHVQPVREVLDGRRLRYKLRFGDAILVFHHGCLMGQVVHNGRIRALPPFFVNADGTPCLAVPPAHRQHWLEEFLDLPKSVLLFYFSLLKEVFKGYALAGRWEDPASGNISARAVPETLHAVLAEVDWRTR